MNLLEIIKDEHRVLENDSVPYFYRFDDYVGEQERVTAVVFPLTHDEVVGVVKYAEEHNLNILARGAGTGLSGATAPLHNELIIDLSKMNKIIGLDESTMTLTVEPGVLLEEIQHYVESRGFFYPPDPGSKNSSIGGNVATNAGGMRAVKYGVTRDYVRSLKIVLVDGQTLTVGSTNVKSSSGYDLKNIFIGSEGTLGITTQIKLKLIPLPKHKKSYLLAFDSLVEATKTVAPILKAGIDPTAVEFFERDMINMSEKETGLKLPTRLGNAFLLVTLDGNTTLEIDERGLALDVISKDHDCVDFLVLEGDLEHQVWHLRDKLLTAVVNYTEQVTMDETVPINHVATLYETTKELEAAYGLKLMSFGHAGDGNLHTCVLRGDIKDDAEWHHKRDTVLKKLYQRIDELGGLPSAEHGIGVIKKPYFEEMTESLNLKVMKDIKKIFDPKNRLNADKVVTID